jgi:sarcosine oxidase subunit alpha
MKRLPGHAEEPVVTFDFEGQTVPAREGEPLASALIASGRKIFSRSVKYHRPRGAFCMASSCAQCLVRVDGNPNVFACRTPVKPGMKVERQNAFPTADFDVLSAADWLFPKGVDHHTLLANVPLSQDVMVKAVRALSGLGLLPDKPRDIAPTLEDVHVEVLIVGAGPAGRAAAKECQGAGVPFLLMEQEAALAAHSNALFATAIGVYTDATGRFVAAVKGESIVRAYAKRFLFCTGGHPYLLPFESNDLPGVYAGQALHLLLERDRVLPGKVVALFGPNDEREALEKALLKEGARVVVSQEALPERALGINEVTGVCLRLPSGKEKRIACDTIGLCQKPAPSFELPRQAGATVEFDVASGVFKVKAGPDGQTHAPDVYVAGDVKGARGPTEAANDGTLSARALLKGLRGVS